MDNNWHIYGKKTYIVLLIDEKESITTNEALMLETSFK